MTYHSLAANHEFPARSIRLDATAVAKYLQATGDTHALFTEQGFVPPLAVGALAVAALSEDAGFPPGTVHVSQEFEFVTPVRVGTEVVCRLQVGRNVHRGGMYLMSIDVIVAAKDGQKILTGKVGFVLPEPEAGKDGS